MGDTLWHGGEREYCWGGGVGRLVDMHKGKSKSV